MSENPVDALVDERYLAGSAAAVDYVAALAAAILWEIGFGSLPREPQPLPAAPLGISPDLAFALAWLLEEASRVGTVEITEISEPSGGPVLYRPAAAPSPARLAERRAALEAVRDVAGSSLAMFDYVAARYPDYLLGRRSGTTLLFKGEGLLLWEAYFSAANPLYDVHNQLGWLGLAAAVSCFAEPVDVLELGTGTGGATAAILRGIAASGESRIARLILTDIAPSLLLATLERLTREFPGSVPLARRRLDFSRPFAGQGNDASRPAILLGVNAIHNAPDLTTVLATLRAELPAEGVLVISESICGAGAQVHQDFVFNLLPASRPVESRRRSRFHPAAVWKQALTAAGFSSEIHVNSRGPELALLALAKTG